MSDDKLRVEVTADSAGLQTGMAEAKAAVSDALSGMESTFKSAESAISGSVLNMTNSLMSLGPVVAAAAAAFAGFEAAKSSVEGMETWANTVRGLQNTLGLSAEGASDLAGGLKVLGVSSDEYLSVMMRMERQVKKNEDTFTALGISVRDSTGAFLPQTEVFQNVIDKMQEYKAGTDQVQFAMDVLGPRGANLAFTFLHLKEAQEMALPIMRQLGLEIGQNGVEAAHKLEMQGNALGLVWDGLKVQIGGQLMPVLADLITALGQIAGPVVTAVVDAVKGLMTAMTAAGFAAKEVWYAVIGVLEAVGHAVAAVVGALVRLLAGDASGAYQVLKTQGAAAYQSLNDAGRKMVNQAQIDYNAIKNMWSKNPMEGGEKTGGTKSYVSPNAAEAKEPKSRMPEWEAELKSKEVAENAFFGLSTANEQAYWAAKLALAKAGTDEYRQVLSKINEITLKAGRDEIEQDVKNAKEHAALEAQTASDAQKRLEAELKVTDGAAKAKEKEVETKYKLNQLSVSSELAQLTNLENARYAAEHDILLREIALWDEGSEHFSQVQDKMLEAAQKHAAQIKQIENQAALETQKTWQQITSPIKGAFDSMFQGINSGTQTFNQAMMKFLSNLGTAFLKMGVDIAMKWIESQIMASMGVKAVKSAEATSVISANAAEAASGAASAEASIPYVGPALAVAAAAAMMAMVMGYESMASAASGYDVPAGINPVTQIHEEEMVLPADLARGVRSMTRGGGSGGNSYSPSFHITSFTPKDTMRAIKQAHRMGQRP